VSPARLRIGCSTAENSILAAYVVYPGGRPLPRGLSVADALFDAGASVQNGPSWLRSMRFTIEATTKVPTSVEEMRGPLIQRVLNDRFKLRAHEASRDMAVYELVQDKGGAAEFKPAQPGSCFEMDATKTPPTAHGGKAPPPICGGFRRSEAGGVDGYHVTIASICRAVSNGLNKPVVDKTGLTGLYDVHLEVAFEQLPVVRGMFRNRPQPPDSSVSEAADSDGGGSVFAAMRKLGFRLQSAKGVAKVIVIDHIELPSAN